MSEWLSKRSPSDKLLDKIEPNPGATEHASSIFGIDMPNADAFSAHLANTATKIYERGWKDLTKSEQNIARKATKSSRPDLWGGQRMKK